MDKRILVIEDDRELADLIVERLIGEGFETSHVIDGLMGVSEAHKFKPHLIILDLMLPGGGGLNVLDKLKMSTHTRHIPIIVLTGSDNDELKKKVLDCGISSYMQKPYDGKKLVEEIWKILRVDPPSKET